MRLPLKPWLTAITVLILTPVIVVAQEQVKPYEECTREPTEGDVGAAKGAFQAGQAAFNEADYPKAITYWEDAFRRDCTANALLLNLARAYELNGQKRQGVVALQTYLQREPNSPQRDQIQRRIDVLNNQIAAATPTAAPTATTTPTATPTSTGPVQPDTPPDSGGKKPLVPLIVAGVGGAVAIVGGILYLGAASDVKEIEDRCGGGRKCENEADITAGNDARDRQTVAGIITLGGVGIAVGGLVWYLVSEPEGAQTAKNRGRQVTKRAPRVAPAFAPGFAGLGVSGTF
jgi:hypothetical protein